MYEQLKRPDKLKWYEIIAVYFFGIIFIILGLIGLNNFLRYVSGGSFSFLGVNVAYASTISQYWTNPSPNPVYGQFYINHSGGANYCTNPVVLSSGRSITDKTFFPATDTLYSMDYYLGSSSTVDASNCIQADVDGLELYTYTNTFDVYFPLYGPTGFEPDSLTKESVDNLNQNIAILGAFCLFLGVMAGTIKNRPKKK